MPLKSGLVFDK